MRNLILGYGASGRAAEALAKARGDEVVVMGDGAQGGPFARVIVSPGVRVESELQFGCEELRRKGCKLLAVTGSKGKSSVVKIVAEALGGVPCGNYGRPVSDVALKESPEWAVVEVSSFMLETTVLPPDAFEAAALLNLQEDHLDRHGSPAAYHALKRRLLGFAKTSREPATAQPVANAEALMRGSYFDNAVLRENGASAIWLMRQAGLDDAVIRAAFECFEPLPHRMNRVAEHGGVTYVDDSKATSIAALVAGLTMAQGSAAKPSVRLIAGGRAKGDDPGTALPEMTRCAQKVYLIGECAQSFYEAWSGSVPCETCATLDRAVERARCEAKAGEKVLLSPGTASFDQFNSFEERGEVFARLVK